ncbi:MAG: tetratricopeptide repeat protein [Methanomicrobiales archaeon]|nr:tetratricopeptide repeat protein [Methanomicrobiales archaeon]
MRTILFALILIFSLVLIPAVSAEDALEWYTKAQNAASAGNYNEAITFYNNALSLDPDYAAALSGKAVVLNQQKKYSEALEMADKALALRATDPNALNARALALFGMMNYNASVKAYNDLFTVQVNRVDAYCNQGYAYFQQGMYAEAISPYDRCTSMDPLNFMSWNYKGLAYMGIGKYEMALNAFDQATVVTVSNATVWNNKGEALVALNKPQDALQCFNKALGIDPNFTKAKANKESVMGKQQVVNISGTITPVPTISRIGTFWTTATPVLTPTEAIALPPGDQPTPGPGETGSGSQPATTVPKRTTYSPLSPLTIIGALAGVGCIAVYLRRQ